MSLTVCQCKGDLIFWASPAILSFIRNAMAIMVESRVIFSRPCNQRCLWRSFFTCEMGFLAEWICRICYAFSLKKRKSLKEGLASSFPPLTTLLQSPEKCKLLKWEMLWSHEYLKCSLKPIKDFCSKSQYSTAISPEIYDFTVVRVA